MKRALALVALTVAVLSPAATSSGAAGPSPAAPALHRVEAPSVDQVKRVQTLLASLGYTIVVDGVYGKQTTRAVLHWQRANGLAVDGIAGPVTIGSLEAAVAGAPAVRVGVVDPLAGLVGCARYEYLMREGGLPERFGAYDLTPGQWSKRDGIMLGESGCDPNAVSRTGCCRGLFQLHDGNVRAPGYRDRIAAECGITRVADYWPATDDDDIRRQVCFARIIYEVSGLTQPWSRTCDGMCWTRDP